MMVKIIWRQSKMETHLKNGLVGSIFGEGRNGSDDAGDLCSRDKSCRRSAPAELGSKYVVRVILC